MTTAPNDATHHSAHGSTVEDHVRQLQDRFDRAELHDDRDTLRELLDENFVSIGPKGFLLDKTQWIDRHDFFTYHELETTDIDVRVYCGGDTVIVRDVQRNRATSQGHPVQIATRVGQVWVHRDDTWRLAGIQFSPLAEG